MSVSFAEWTRLKNDAIRETCDHSQSSAPLKYVTYAPEYLTEQSCTVGSANNCRITGQTKEYDFRTAGKLSNLRENQRQTTNHSAYGIVGASQASGPLLSFDAVRTQTELYGAQELFRKSCDVTPEGQPVHHQLDTTVLLSSPLDGFADRLVPRLDQNVSTRVVRRNQWHDQSCGATAPKQ